MLGEKKIHPTYGVQIFKNDKGRVNTDILTQFIDYAFAPIRYKFDSEIMPKSITKTQKEFERDINNLFAPPYGKISYYDSPDKNINKQQEQELYDSEQHHSQQRSWLNGARFQNKNDALDRHGSLHGNTSSHRAVLRQKSQQHERLSRCRTTIAALDGYCNFARHLVRSRLQHGSCCDRLQ